MPLGYKFKGINISAFGVYFESKNRQVLPMQKVSYIDIPGRDGSLLFNGGSGDRYIYVGHSIPKKPLSELRSTIRLISAWLHSSEREQLIFDDEPDKYYMAKVDGSIDLEQTFRSRNFDVTFRCEPYAYALTAKTADFVADTTTVENVGTVTCWPVFTVTFTDLATELKIIKGTEYVRVVRDFVIGDVVVIDNSEGTIKLHGASIMSALDWQNSIFFSLDTGENIVNITPANKATVTITYRERWQ